MQKRVFVVGILFGVAAVTLVGRLFFWQVIKARELSASARLQYEGGSRIHASRGSIKASDGTWLAASVESWLVYVAKNEMEDSPEEVAETLSAVLYTEEERENKKIEIENILSDTDSVWVPIKHKVSTDVKKNIEAMGVDGVGFEREEDRFYPEASSSAHLVGFVGKDDEGMDKGYFGLEGYYDLTLTGNPGFLQGEFDASGAPIAFGEVKEVTASNGVDLITHIDKRVQFLVEEKLKNGLEAYGASSGMVIVMDPGDGGIMAAASFPSFDPKNYFEYGDEFFRNPIVSDAFEPGSVFKPIVMASALDIGAVEPDTVCDVCGGPVKVDKYTIETWDKKYYPDSTMTDVIVHSDNVGMTFVGQRLGAEKLYDYLVAFGFGEVTGIDLQGESRAKIREKKDWSYVDVATATFGQGIAVTPIQLIKAFSVIANDGVAVSPQVVDKIAISGWERDVEPEIGGQVISKEAADEITKMMVYAAEKGEAKWTAVKGFGVAGKTGTAQIPIAGHYDDEKTIASFVGFAPYDRPKFVMLVSLREPQSSQWASETAAPLWYSIANELFPYFSIQPKY